MRRLSRELDGRPEAKIERATVIDRVEDLAGESVCGMPSGERLSMRVLKLIAGGHDMPAAGTAERGDEEWVEAELFHSEIVHG